MESARCVICRDMARCTACGMAVSGFHHVGVRKPGLSGSSVMHYSKECGHRVDIPVAVTGASQLSPPAVYHGGPVWKDGYRWFNIFWGSFWQSNSWVARIGKAVKDIESDPSYSGELRQYGVGMGKLAGDYIVGTNPTSSVSAGDIGKEIQLLIRSASIPDLGTEGAYNIFLPPGVSATLSGDRSCSVFCDYHDTVDGNHGPFFTCEPYPCQSGCNQCNSDPFDTLTQGLSEEMVELKTDMNPGTGWVIGNEEICDYCDQHFECNRITTGEYVNAWYDNSSGSCWTP